MSMEKFRFISFSNSIYDCNKAVSLNYLDFDCSDAVYDYQEFIQGTNARVGSILEVLLKLCGFSVYQRLIQGVGATLG